MASSSSEKPVPALASSQSANAITPASGVPPTAAGSSNHIPATQKSVSLTSLASAANPPHTHSTGTSTHSYISQPPLLILEPLTQDPTSSLYFQTKSLDLTNKIKLGRVSTQKTEPTPCNGFFGSKVLSRDHAEVWYENGKVLIRDTRSSNGTYLNNARLSAENTASPPFELQHGDILELGIDIREQEHGDFLFRKVLCRVGLLGDLGAMASGTAGSAGRRRKGWGLRKERAAGVEVVMLESRVHTLTSALQAQLTMSSITTRKLDALSDSVHELRRTMAGVILTMSQSSASPLESAGPSEDRGASSMRKATAVGDEPEDEGDDESADRAARDVSSTGLQQRRMSSFKGLKSSPRPALRESSSSLDEYDSHRPHHHPSSHDPRHLTAASAIPASTSRKTKPLRQRTRTRQFADNLELSYTYNSSLSPSSDDDDKTQVAHSRRPTAIGEDPNRTAVNSRRTSIDTSAPISREGGYEHDRTPSAKDVRETFPQFHGKHLQLSPAPSAVARARDLRGDHEPVFERLLVRILNYGEEHHRQVLAFLVVMGVAWAMIQIAVKVASVVI